MIEYDLIGDVGEHITSTQVSEMLLAAKGKDVTFFIASLGGSLSEGSTIYGLIKKYKGNTKGIIIGNTASAGTIAILGCDTVECNINAPFLIHNSSDPIGGNAAELKKKAAELEKHDKIMLSIYRDKTGLPDAKLQELMALSDWILPTEAKAYGFIDSVIESKYKAVAYASNTKLSNDLLTKLNKKMFGKKKDDKVVNHIYALKDGGRVLANAEAPEVGAEVQPIGAAMLEDGEYELTDGSKIVVAGGVITEVIPAEMAAAEPTASTDEVVAAVSAIVAEQMDVVRAEFKAELAKVSSSHKPAKSGIVTAKAATVDVQGKVKDITDGIRQKLVESRKA